MWVTAQIDPIMEKEEETGATGEKKKRHPGLSHRFPGKPLSSDGVWLEKKSFVF